MEMARRFDWLGERPTDACPGRRGCDADRPDGQRARDPSGLSAFPLGAQLAALAVGAAIAGSGMVVWERRPGNPIGPLLVLAGALWFLARLQGAAWPPLGLAASLGNALSQTVIVAVLVAFPSGRITSRVGWAIVVFAGIAMIGISVTSLITTEARNTPAIRGPNPFYIPMDPAFRSLLRGTFLTASSLVAVVAIGWLVTRWRRASGPARRTFTPVFVTGAVVGVVTLTGEMLVNTGNLSTAQFQLVVTIQILSFALFPAAILVGVLRDRMARSAVADLVVELGETPAPERMREALAGALRDPTLEVVYWSAPSERYVDAHGVPVDLEHDARGRAVTLLERDGRPLAALLHDPRWRRTRAWSRRSVPPSGSPWTTSGSPRRFASSSPRYRRLGPGSSRRATRSADVSNGTSMTVRSSAWWLSHSPFGEHRPRYPRTPIRR